MILGRGVIGSALKRAVPDALVAARGAEVDIDLACAHEATIPVTDVLYVAAGINGTAECDSNPMSWCVNVDGVIDVAKRYAREHALMVYISTTYVESKDTNYARQRRAVEFFLQATGDPLIVRPCRITEENSDRFAKDLVAMAEKGERGVRHWNG